MSQANNPKAHDSQAVRPTTPHSLAASGLYHEMVISKAIEGFSQAAMLKASGVLQDWVKDQPGFISRELFEDVDQRVWIDHVLWRDEASAKAAMAHFFTAPCAHALDGLIDMPSMQIFHAYERFSSAIQ